MFLTTPVPHKEAASFISGKPAVAMEVFAELPAELKALAFTITGVEDLKVLQKARDLIAKLPLGGNYEDLKKELVDTISPYMKSEKGAQIRAELLLRLHGGQAYAASQHRVMMRQTDVFPYWQYLTFGDHRVRASHVALDKKIFRWDSPFWDLHYPPWEYLCRCRVAPLTRGQVEKIRAADAKLPAVKRRLLEGPLLDKALTDHVLFSPADDGTTVNITPPSINDPEKGYRWSPGSIGVPMEKLKAGFDADLWQQFEDKAKATKISSQKTLWQGMEKLGQDYKPEPAKEVISPEKKKAILKALGMTEKQYQEWKAQQDAASAPLLEIVSSKPRTFMESVQDVHAKHKADLATLDARAAVLKSERDLTSQKIAEFSRIGDYSSDARQEAWSRHSQAIDRHEAAVRAVAQLKNDLLDQYLPILTLPPVQRGQIQHSAPPSLAALARRSLELFTLIVDQSLFPKGPVKFAYKRGRAQYNALIRTVEINKNSGVRTGVHELGHWIEMHRPDILQKLVDFRAQRTVGEAPQKLRKLTGNPNYKADENAYEDKFLNKYMGKIYPGDFATEILTMGLEHYLFETGDFAERDPDYFNFIHQLITTTQP